MASNINANNIDGNYPVAGQDNDSQGFRDNFTNTRTNFQFAANEINDLQQKVVLKQALDGTVLDNDMGGSVLSNARFQNIRESVVSNLPTAGTVTIDYALGPYYAIPSTTGSVTLAFTNLSSAGTLSTFRVQITISNVAHTLILPTAVGTANSLKSLENIIGANVATRTITFNETGTYVFEFRTSDNGTSIYIEDLIRSAGATELVQLNDVDIEDPQNNNILAYNSTNEKWENVAQNEFLPTTEIVVTVADNGSGTQDVFYLDSVALKTNTGVTIDFQFQVGRRYRFDVSDPSNGEFKFSTTPDTIVPDTITDFTTGVTSFGTPGTAGAYVDIVITEQTPTPLYFWTPDLTEPVRDGSLIGAALPISVGQTNYFFGEDTFAANGNISLQTTTTVVTSSANLVGALPAGEPGQVKILAYGNTSAGNTLITVENAAWGGSNIANLSATGSAATFQYVNGKWFCTGNNGVTFS
jgi:hypothetical protein